MTVRIDGKSLTIEDVINVCRHYEKVEITEDAKITVNRSRDYVREKLENDAVIYGLTTGFGRFANVKISFEDTAQLQKNLIGMGYLDGSADGIYGAKTKTAISCR